MPQNAQEIKGKQPSFRDNILVARSDSKEGDRFFWLVLKLAGHFTRLSHHFTWQVTFQLRSDSKENARLFHHMGITAGRSITPPWTRCNYCLLTMNTFWLFTVANGVSYFVALLRGKPIAISSGHSIYISHRPFAFHFLLRPLVG